MSLSDTQICDVYGLPMIHWLNNYYFGAKYKYYARQDQNNRKLPQTHVIYKTSALFYDKTLRFRLHWKRPGIPHFNFSTLLYLPVFVIKIKCFCEVGYKLLTKIVIYFMLHRIKKCSVLNVRAYFVKRNCNVLLSTYED